MDSMEPLPTDRLGGVEVSASDLKAMQDGDYILHACGGKLEKIPVEKIRLPLDPQGHPQRLNMALAPDGTLLASQQTLFHISHDGGKTWEHFERDPARFGFGGLIPHGWRLQFDQDGTLLNFSNSKTAGSPAVWASHDQGSTWREVGTIAPQVRQAEVGFSVARLDDGTLLAPVTVRDAKYEDEKLVSGTNSCSIYRSRDAGRNWALLSPLGEWSVEVNLSVLPSGRILAAIRRGFGAVPHKIAYVAHSDDRGATWTPQRQVTTVHGQCFASAVGLADGSAVFIHDHRYPRNVSGARAMVSRDAGQTWSDEVYYLNNGDAGGYAASISIDGREMLTFTGSVYGDISTWDKCIGRTNFVLVRWQLV